MSDAKLQPEDLTSEERAFNKLTPTQTELLALLAEECGEVVQIIGKILRHGLESRHPNGGPTNRELLAEELGDCLCASRLLASAGMLNLASVEDRSEVKMKRVFRYLHHAHTAPFAAPATSEPEKVECPNCGHGDDWSHGLGYNGACMRREKPAPPEPAARVDTTKTVAYCDELDVRYGKPAAPEMPAPIFYAIADLRRANYFSTAASLETFWSAQATAPKKLEKVDPPACNTSGPLRLLVKLIKSAGVANLTNGVQLGAISWSVKMTDAMQWADAAIAELDAYERGGREGK